MHNLDTHISWYNNISIMHLHFFHMMMMVHTVYTEPRKLIVRRGNVYDEF